MSTTHKLPFTRFTKQASTEPVALLSTDAAAIQAAALLQDASWVESSMRNWGFPPRAAVLEAGAGTPLPGYDAYKYCGEYADGKQKAYAGAVAYRYLMPAEALTGTVAEVVTVDVPLYVDRWLVDGVRLAAYVSDDPMPPSAWATIRDGDAKLDAQLPMTYTDPAGDRIVVEKNDTLTVTMPDDLDAKKYLYIMVTLEDYESSRGFWIEGAALILGASVDVEFDRAVTADAITATDTDYSEVTLTKPFLIDASNETSSTIFENNGTAIDILIGTGGTDRHVVNNVKTILAREQVPNFDTVTALAATWNRAPSGATTVVRIKGALQSLAGGLMKPGTLSSIRFTDAFPSYPDWMSVRMNLYYTAGSYIASVISPNLKFNTWRNGTQTTVDISGSDVDCSNLLSETLSPLGYPAGKVWTAKAVSLPADRLNCFLSFQIENILSDPPATTDSALGFSLTPTFITLIME